MSHDMDIAARWQPDIFIYHSPCDDGFGAAWAAWMRWRDAVEYVPATYGKPPPDVTGKRVLIGDFSFKKPIMDEMAAKAKSIIILDHHKSAEEDLKGYPPPYFGADNPDIGLDFALPIWALFDMSKSGARLVWEFCHFGQEPPPLIRYIEDRDLWRFTLPETKAFSLWLRSHPYDFDEWELISQELNDGRGSARIMSEAGAIQGFYDQKVAEMVREARIERINGVAVPVVNCSWAFASDVAHELLAAHPDAPFAACYYDRGDGSRTYSLRSEDHRADASAIAKRYGGGGHRNAAGFEVPLP